MTELTELIKRLSSFYGLIIEDRREDDFWDESDFVGEKAIAIFLIRSEDGNFFWASNESEDDFLNEIEEMFLSRGKDSVAYY